MSDEKKCDRCGVVQDVVTTDIEKVNIGCLGGEILNTLSDLPFRTDLCKDCRAEVAECIKRK